MPESQRRGVLASGLRFVDNTEGLDRNSDMDGGESGMEILIVVLVLAMLLFAMWMRRLQVALAAIDVSLGQIAKAITRLEAAENRSE